MREGGLEIRLELNEEMSIELVEAARDCQSLSPRQFALDCVESILASRRLPHVFVPTLTQGPQHARGTRQARREDGPELRLVEHDFRFPDREIL